MKQEPRNVLEKAILLLRASLVPGLQPPTAGQGLVWAIRCAIVLGGFALVAPAIVSAVDKSLWDWLNLLIVPVVLALGAYLFTRSENRRAQDIARQHAEDSELRTYFEQMGKLLLGQDTPGQVCLRESNAESDIHHLARAWTTSTLEKLTGKGRKRRLLRFLYESHLIDKDKPVVSLERARLQEANLEDAILREADLSGAWLDKANLRDADLSNTKLIGTRLIGADLSGANVSNASLLSADLSGASGVTKEQLDQAESLEGATMPDGQTLKGVTTPNNPTYEEWLKGKEGRREDGENSSPS